MTASASEDQSPKVGNSPADRPPQLLVLSTLGFLAYGSSASPADATEGVCRIHLGGLDERQRRIAQVAAAPKKFLGTALKLAKSPAAASLPGYVGDKPVSFTCPDDD
jgi:hypothetical protein